MEFLHQFLQLILRKIEGLKKTIPNQVQTLKDFNRAIRLNPQCSECFFNRSKFYFWARGDEKTVFADLDKAVGLSPKNREYLAYWANLYFLIGEYEKSLSDYDLILKLNPKDTDALIMKGRNYFALKNYQKAIDDYSMALRIQLFFSPVILAHRAKAYRALGKVAEAEADEETVKKLVKP